MSAERKVWVLDNRNPGSRGNRAMAGSGDRLARNRAAGAAGSSGTAPGAAPRPAPWLEILAAYLLGPLSPPVLREGGMGWLWILVAPLTAAYWYMLIDQRNRIPETAGFTVLLAGVALGAVLIGLTLAGWSRSVDRLGIAARTLRSRSPSLQNPLTLLLLGFLAPGLGLVLAGRPRRGAAAFWFIGMGAAAGVVVWFAGDLWDWSRTRSNPETLSLLELCLLGTGVFCLVGIASWIIQLLDGARMGTALTSKRMKSDWVFVSLVGAILLFLGLSQPVTLARELDGFATAKHTRGYHVLPLVSSMAAMKLDPSQPRYALAAAGFLDEMGRGALAEQIREDLDQRWSVYADWLFEQEKEPETNPMPGGILPPDAIRWSEITALDAFPPPPAPF